MTELITKEFGPLKMKALGTVLFLDGEMKYWVWTPYDKCSFRCVYCSVEAQGKSKPLITKEEIAPLLDDFHRQVDNTYPFVIGTRADPYPAEEAEYQLTRHALQELAKRPEIRTVLITHGAMITRDLDILKTMPNLEKVGISITHHDDEQLKSIEPGAPGFRDRIEAAIKVHEAGLPLVVNIAPWIPDFTDVEKIARELPADVEVNVAVLSYNLHNRDLTRHLFGREVSSAERVFSKQFPNQEVINQAYLKAHQQTGGGSKGNLKWLIPPGSGKNYINTLPNP
jgi:DNA repair photolyase